MERGLPHTTAASRRTRLRPLIRMCLENKRARRPFHFFKTRSKCALSAAKDRLGGNWNAGRLGVRRLVSAVLSGMGLCAGGGTGRRGKAVTSCRTPSREGRSPLRCQSRHGAAIPPSPLQGQLAADGGPGIKSKVQGFLPPPHFPLTLGGGRFTIGKILGARENFNGGIQILFAPVRARPRGRV